MKTGEVIAIIGAPGVGKSFLVKQLACRQCAPAFFEGEEGVFPEKVLAVLNNENDSPERFEWLLNRTQVILERARRIANQGITVYVDGDVLQVHTWLKAEIGAYSPTVLEIWLKENEKLSADKVLVLTASLSTIQQNRERRGRASEQNSFISQRSERIQQASLILPKSFSHASLLDRTNLNFTDEKTLEQILELIDNIPSR